jgi:hypothetical protein
MIAIRTKTVAISTAVLLTAGGAAFAAWTITTNGGGTATTATIQPVTFQLTGNPLDGMWAGDLAKDIPVWYINPNSRAISKHVTATVASTSSTACPTDSFKIMSNTDAATLAANNSGAVDKPPTIQILDSAPDGCQGVSVTLTFGLS